MHLGGSCSPLPMANSTELRRDTVNHPLTHCPPGDSIKILMCIQKDILNLSHYESQILDVLVARGGGGTPVLSSQGGGGRASPPTISPLSHANFKDSAEQSQHSPSHKRKGACAKVWVGVRLTGYS